MIFNFLLVGMALFAVVAIKAQDSGKMTNPTQTRGDAATTAAAQPTAVTPLQLPTHPNKLMALAAKVNGLAGLNDRPWRVKFTVQSFDEDGKPLQSGTLEEWWESANKYKYIYTGPGFQQTTYGDGKKEVVTGDPGWPAFKIVADMIGGFLWTPLPSPKVASSPEYKVQHTSMGQVKLTCEQPLEMSPLLSEDSVTLMATDAHRVSTTCFSDGSAAARVVITHYGIVALFNNVVEFDGHYIAKQIQMEDGNKLAATLNVVQLDFPKSIPEAELDGPSASPPPVNASEIELPSRAMDKYFIRQDKLEYPKDAKTQHLSGYIAVIVHIDQNGHVAGVQGVMGPRILLDPVMKWLKTFRYRPYKVNGKAVAVRTRYVVIFRAQG